MREFKKGELVTIFEDPLTETKIEGKAKIVRKDLDLSDGVGLYTVEFPGYEGTHLQRQIKERK